MSEDLLPQVIPVNLGAIEVLQRAEIDTQIATAKNWPRSIQKCQDRAFDMACVNIEVAESCSYLLPRKKKDIIGASVRFAEIMANAWTNLRVSGRVVDIGDKFITAQGVAWDHETNVAVGGDVIRRITDKYGKRYNDDMIGVTGNAAVSIAIRNAIFKAVPKAYWGPIWKRVRKVARGDESTLDARRSSMLKWFSEKGVGPDTLLQLVGKSSMEDVGVDDVVKLREIATGIDDGDTTVDGLLASLAPETKKPGAKKSLAEKAAAAKKPEQTDAELDKELGEQKDLI